MGEEYQRSLTLEELKELIQSTVNLDDIPNTQKFEGNIKHIDPKNILFEFNFTGLKFTKEQNTVMEAILFKDMIDNLFLKVTLSHLPNYVLIERINNERVCRISGT